MSTLGPVGGSGESTALYYRWINEGVRNALGPLGRRPSCFTPSISRMEEAFYRECLAERGIEVLVPDPDVRA